MEEVIIKAGRELIPDLMIAGVGTFFLIRALLFVPRYFWTLYYKIKNRLG